MYVCLSYFLGLFSNKFFNTVIVELFSKGNTVFFFFLFFCDDEAFHDENIHRNTLGKLPFRFWVQEAKWKHS